MPAPSPEMVAYVRQRYVDGDPVAQIAADAEMSHGMLYYCLDGGPKDAAGQRLPPIPRRRDVLKRRRLPALAERLSLIARLWRTAERQVRDIEACLAGSTQAPTERERNARSLAVLARTLRELTLIDAAPGARDAKSDTAKDDDAGPRDIDEFRRELARRMDAIVARRKAGGAGNPGSGEA